MLRTVPGHLSFDRVATIYDETRSLAPRAMARLLAVLVDELHRKRVLEIGVGTGRYAVPLQKSGIRVVGVDISRLMVEFGLAKGLRDVVFAEGAHLPCGARSLDVATTNHVLHLVPNWREGFAEIARVTQEMYFTVIERSQRVDSIQRDYDDLLREAAYEYHHPRIHERDLPSLVKPAKGAGQRLRAEVGRAHLRRHPQEERERVVRGQERTTLPQIQQHERVETGTAVLEYPLERTRRAESGGRKGNRRGPSELVHLEPEGTRSGGEDRNSVDDSGRNLRCSGPQTEIHMGRRGHRITDDEERDLLFRSRLQNRPTVLHVGPREHSNFLPDELLYGSDRGARQARRVELREDDVGRARFIEAAQRDAFLVVEAQADEHQFTHGGGRSRMRGLDPSLGLHEPRKPFSTRAYRSSHASLGGRRSARTRGGNSADPPRTRRAAETSSDRPRGRLDSPPDPRTRGPRLSHEGRRVRGRIRGRPELQGCH